VKKTKRFGGGGGTGRSAYQGNESSYKQESDSDASDSVGKGAASRRLATAAAAREEAPARSTRASRDFDAVDMPKISMADMDELEAANKRENLSPVGPRGMPSRVVTPTPSAAESSSSGRKPSVSQAALNAMKDQEVIDRMANRKRAYMKDEAGNDMKRGGKVKKMASGGKVSSASSRADGIAQRGKTRGIMVMCGGGMARGKK
jgi:hypothetical protein